MENTFEKYYNYLEFLLKIECENLGKKFEEVVKGEPSMPKTPKPEPKPEPKLEPKPEPETAVSPYDLEFPDGYYIGETKNGKMHGKGVRHFNKSGSEWNGEWKEGKACGKMTIILHGVEVYRGEMKDDAMNGKGRFIVIDKRQVYDGHFANGKYDGAGTLYNEDGVVLYEGNWSKGRRDGTGKSYYSNGKIQYDGCWKDNHYEGQGTAYDLTGKQLYSGIWKDGNPVDENARLDYASV